MQARLASLDGRRVAQGRDFARNGTLTTADAVQLDEASVRDLGRALEEQDFADICDATQGLGDFGSAIRDAVRAYLKSEGAPHPELLEG